MYPGDYEGIYGIKPGTLPRHKLPGTSYPGIDFPHIRQAVREGVLDDVELVSDEATSKAYARTKEQGIIAPLPCWDDDKIENHEDLGRSTKAGIAVALGLIQGEESIKDSTFVVIGYDKAERY
jgi:hypothetical protein